MNQKKFEFKPRRMGKADAQKRRLQDMQFKAGGELAAGMYIQMEKLIALAPRPQGQTIMLGDITSDIYPDGIEIVKYMNKPFLVLYPIEMRLEGMKMIATRQYKVIK
jgi:hypothetical protein